MPATTTAGPTPLFSPGFAINPEPTLAHLRNTDPLHLLAPGVIVVTRYADCRAALVAPGLSAAGGQADRKQRSGAATSMLNTDDDAHRRLRRPGHQLLGPGAIDGILPTLRSQFSDFFAQVADRDTVDLATEVSEPLATLALTCALGVQDGPEPDGLGHLFAESAAALDPMPSADGAAQARRAVAKLDTWVERHLGTYPNGRLGRLITPDVARDDVVGIANLAVVGGWAPLAELLTTAIELALYNPDHRQAALGGQASTWCEDVIRWHTPIPFVARKATTDVDLPGGVVPKGTQVIIHIGSSGRDTEQFSEAGVAIDRPQVRQHLALGAGAHFCLGAPLVRAVLPVALDAFFRGLPGARTRGTLFAWRPGVFPRRPLSTAVLLS